MRQENDTGLQSHEVGEIIFSDEQISARIAEMAKAIAKEYQGKQLLVIGLMKGGFRVLSDLTAQLHESGLTDLEISMLTTKSYLDQTTAQQEPTIIHDIDIDPTGRHILLVDDIADTGKSLRMVNTVMQSRQAASVASAVLLDKPSRREVEYAPTFVGFTIPDIWVQGRGMDSSEVGRADSNIRKGPHFFSARR